MSLNNIVRQLIRKIAPLQVHNWPTIHGLNRVERRAVPFEVDDQPAWRDDSSARSKRQPGVDGPTTEL